MLGFLPTRAYRPGTPGATTFLSPLSGTFNYGWDSFLLLLPLGCDGGNELTGPACDDAIATFEDAALEAAIRAALGVGAQEGLTCHLISGLTELDAEGGGIESLVGIQNLTNLAHLGLRVNSITDISALGGLTNLTELDVTLNSVTDLSALSGLTGLTRVVLGANSISDISALSGLTGLTELILDQNSIADISPLSGLTSLTTLHLMSNRISDISPLAGLTSLTDLSLIDNLLTDIGPVQGLTSLTSILLGSNFLLSDVQPLLDNTGLGARDFVSLNFTNVSCADIALLVARRVRVDSTGDCP